MKKSIITVIKIALLLILFNNNAFSQGAPSMSGKEFWLSFGLNFNQTTNDIELQIRIVATKATEVRFSFTQNSTCNDVLQLAAGQVYTYELSNLQEDALYSNTTGTTDKTLYISSDEDVTVFAINMSANSTDATNVLPVNNYGTEYYTISYGTMMNPGDGYTIIANEAGTIVTNHAGTPITLNRGQVYSFYDTNLIDLTGKKITSTKPVAMFTTNSVVRVPQNIVAYDCLFQQLAPVHSWGRTFFVPVANPTNGFAIKRNRDRIRILASQDGTTVTQTGGTIQSGGQGSLNNLKAGQFVELEINIANNGCYISSNKPVAVTSYLIGGSAFGNPVVGDPAMAWVPPLEQSQTRSAMAPFFASSSSVLLDDQHYALIVTPTLTKNETTMSVGGDSPVALSGGIWRDHLSSGYSFYSMNFPSIYRDSTY